MDTWIKMDDDQSKRIPNDPYESAINKVLLEQAEKEHPELMRSIEDGVKQGRRKQIRDHQRSAQAKKTKEEKPGIDPLDLAMI